MARSLVSVRQISRLQPLEDSAFLLAHVDGWTCAMKQGTAKVGDYILFFEIDSFLPVEDHRFLSLGRSNASNGNLILWNGRYGFHVKSTKQQGTVVSQGLIMPLNIFPEIAKVVAELKEANDTEDALQKLMGIPFENHLKVLKWEQGTAAVKVTKKDDSLGKPPTFFPKTDINRVQNCPNLFTKKYKDAVFQESVKLDGSAATIYFVCRDTAWYESLPALDGRADMPQGRFGVCSRKLDLPDKPDCPFWKTALHYRLPQKLSALGKNLAISGELCGASIGQNREGFATGKHDFFVYRIFDIDAHAVLGPRETEQRAKQLGLKHVPVNGYYRLHDIAASREGLLQRAEGVGMFGKPREGLVYKNVNDGRCFKVISNAYLVENGE